MKQEIYRSMAEITNEKRRIRAAIEQQQTALVAHYKSLLTPLGTHKGTSSLLDYLLPMVEGVWFGVKIRRLVRNFKGSIKWLFSLFSPKRHL